MTPSRPVRPVDASMDLLNQIIRQPIDPDYARVAARGAAPSRLRWPLTVVALVIGMIFAVAGLQTTRAAPANTVERTELINRIDQAEQDQDILRQQIATLNAQIAQLRADALGNDDTARSLETQIGQLGPQVGTVAVLGPGVVITVDDAVDDLATNDKRYQVLDIDLQQLVNGLWSAGAEAISINGHRLSALTAIRGAGDAITVDYRSLTRPYRIEAIGDPDTLPSRLAESTGGLWWNALKQNYRMRYDVATTDQVTLDADPGIVLRYATKEER